MEQLEQTQPKAEVSAELWSVVVLYEDKPTRDRAMAFCDQLVRNFWSQVEFEFRWWRLDFLTDSDLAQAAAAEARAAAILVFSSRAEAELSPVVLRWFEDWLHLRESPEGMLVDLCAVEALNQPLALRKQARLRELARRAGLDYFNRLPPSLSGGLAASWQEVEARANEVSTVLDDILNRLPPPSHFGLNE